MNLIDLNAGKVTNLPALTQERSGHASEFVDGSIIVAGGQSMVKNKKIFLNSIEKYVYILLSHLIRFAYFTISPFLSTVQRYDIKKGQWKICKPMIRERSLFSMIVAHGFVYAIGGYNGETISAVERYDASANIWMAVEPMNTPRMAATAAQLHGDIYVMGGSTKGNTCETATVEKFCKETEKWIFVAQLSLARDFLLATIYRDSLVVAGGYDENSQETDIVELYDEKHNKWCRVTPMAKKTSGGTLFASNYLT